MTEERKKELATFKRRYGHHFIGLLVLFFMIGIGYLGWRETRPKAETVSADEIMDFDNLGVSYDVKLDALDGENFIYSIYFSHEISDKELDEVEHCVKSLEQLNIAGQYYGHLSDAVRESDDKVTVMLDLWNADNDSMIKNFLKALDNVDGIERVVINEDTAIIPQEEIQFDIDNINTECEFEYKNYGEKTLEIFVFVDHVLDYYESNDLRKIVFSDIMNMNDSQGHGLGEEISGVLYHYAFDTSNTTDYSVLYSVINDLDKNNNVKKIIVQTGADYESEQFDVDAPENYARKQNYIIKDKNGIVIYDSYKTAMDIFGFSFMDLSFDASFEEFCGENFFYNIYFGRDVTKEDIAEIEKRINAECDKYPEYAYIGYISQAEISDERHVTLMLDLGDADNECMITGIVQALNGMDGIERVVINEKTDEPDM
ncbi:MAG: hypothetical protein J6I46_15355 [Ruminococcus sp.]|nr:hypothetical protein [Ruminococcus sp.]